jgi:hypothetical protein
MGDTELMELTLLSDSSSIPVVTVLSSRKTWVHPVWGRVTVRVPPPR